MISKDDFTTALSTMINALPCPAQGNRIKALYHFFSDRDFRRIQETADKIAEHEERFPTPAKFAQWYKTTQSREEKDADYCNLCDGSGWVSIDGEAYRGRCVHGDGIHPKDIEVRLAPESYRSQPIRKATMTDFEIAEKVAENPARYARGIFLLAGPNLEDLAGRPPFIRKMVEIARATLGEKMWEQMRKDWMKRQKELGLPEAGSLRGLDTNTNQKGNPYDPDSATTSARTRRDEIPSALGEFPDHD